MAVKINLLFIFFILSLFLFATSLRNKESRRQDSSHLEAERQLKYGISQDFDQESLVELQLEDMFTSMMDKNSHYLDAPKVEAKPVLKKAKKFIDEEAF